MAAAYLLSALSGCASDEKAAPIFPTVPPSLMASPHQKSEIPSRQLSGEEVEFGWGRDRSGFGQCRSQVFGLQSWIKSVTEK
jgi:hypothetical protein